MIYSVDSILKTEKELAYTFRLDNESIQLFASLVHEIGVPVQKSTTKKHEKGVDWETVRHTKQKPSQSLTTSKKKSSSSSISSISSTSSTSSATVVRKDNTTILTENIDEIRMILNKITDKNYTDTLHAMVNKLTSFNRYYQNGLVDQTMLMTFGGTIFSIATQNQFYSKLYARLIADLVLQFEFLKTIITNYSSNLIETLLNVGDYISEDNYDLFCKMNHDNDHKKSLAEFCVNLNKHTIVSDEMYAMFCVAILKRIMEFVIQPDKSYQVDILAELLSILYDKGKLSHVTFPFVQGFEEDEEWEQFKFNKCIKRFSKAKTTDFKSLTKKTIFKFMDMQGV
jgi:hypothetical protein